MKRGKVTSGTPIKFENTGETLCADCAIKTVGDMMPDESDPATEQFLKETIKVISIKTDVDPILFTVHCKTFSNSDVEIRRNARGYELTLYRLLMFNPEQINKVIDYVVSWIKKHPLEINDLKTKCIGPQQLADDGLFIFLFIPAGRPFPDDADLSYMSHQIAPGVSSNKLGWRVLLQPEDTGPENHAFIGDTLRSWSGEQNDMQGIKLAQKPVQTKSGRKLNCLIAYRDTLS
jgi:hypothetical protein